MNKGKEIPIVGPELKIPEEFQPEWIRRGCTPIPYENIGIRREENMNKDEKPRYPAKILKDDEEVPDIKPNEQMADPKESQWYDEPAQDQLIDNNDYVEVEKLQRHRVVVQENSTKKSNIISSIKEKLTAKPKEDVARIAEPGEFVVWFKNKVVHIGTLESIKEICEKIIIENDDLEDNDLIVFLRVPLTKIFK